jgi:hypothetical protein
MSGDNLLARLWAVFARPGQAMEWVRGNPRWLMAGLLLAILGAFYAVITMPIAGPEQLELMRDTRMFRMLSDEDWQVRYEESLDPTPVRRVTTGIGAAVASFVIVLIYGLIYLLFGKLAGGTGTFKQVMGVTFWAYIIPGGLGNLLRIPLIFAKQSVMEVSLGLAALAPKENLLSAGYQALYYFGDFFVWWALVVTIIGFQKVHDISRGQAAVVTILPWLLVTGAMYGLGRIFM